MKSKKPTRTQRQILEKNKLDTYKWYIQKEFATTLQVVNVDTGEVKLVQKV